jgi:hypothetical protein
MTDEARDERFRASPESDKLVGEARSLDLKPVQSKPIPNLLSDNSHSEEIYAVLKAGCWGGAWIGLFFGLVMGLNTMSLPGLVIWTVVGAGLGISVVLLGLVLFLVMFFACEWPLRMYMSLTSDLIRPRSTGLARWEEMRNESDTAFQQRPPRR